jgi:hypothetical protein
VHHDGPVHDINYRGDPTAIPIVIEVGFLQKGPSRFAVPHENSGTARRTREPIRRVTASTRCMSSGAKSGVPSAAANWR